jgi:hypothetical protein
MGSVDMLINQRLENAKMEGRNAHKTVQIKNFLI